MAKLSTDERFGKVMKFLVASTEKKIARFLAERGFSDEDREEGWSLLDRAAGRHLVITPITPLTPITPITPATFATDYRPILAALDAWAKLWFDVASAALGRRFGSVRDRIFLNLSKTPSTTVLLSVKTFLKRLKALAAEENEESRQAMALLEKRGLNRERMDEASALIGRFTAVERSEKTKTADDDDDDAANKQEREAGVKAMWAWYQEWATMARTAVKNRNYLVMLGLIPHRGGGSGAGGGTQGEAGGDGDTPAIGVSGGE